MRKIVVLLLLVVLIGCKDDDKVTWDCGVEDPANELPWLKTRIEEMKNSGFSQYSYIESATYNLERVFVIKSCCPMCSMIIPVFRCDGTQIDNPDYALLKSSKLIWAPDGFECLLM